MQKYYEGEPFHFINSIGLKKTSNRFVCNLQARNAAMLLRSYFACVVIDQIQEALLEVRGTVIKGWRSKGGQVQEHQFSPWILSSFDTICGCFREVLQLFWVWATA